MHLLGDVSLSRVDAQFRARNACEGEEVAPLDDFGNSYEHIAKGRVHTKWMAIGFVRQSSFNAEPASLVHHAFAVDDGAVQSNSHLEQDVIPGIAPASFPQLFQQEVRFPCATQVNVPG
ncbi:hypothetical protein Q664_20725 [Archangium violaceum Cb vi76]|uniref:Uncharacterized protein n=1 Tax=Archangium violaceum Cb vi76 TaxID=1406225 RepID=A0A084ST29_9BACT|nr:hypothetical protein Q664_20725 [Archangium violaceum Cb vi76]